MNKSILLPTLVSVLISTAPVSFAAEGMDKSTTGARQMPSAELKSMHEKMVKMHDLLHRIRDTQDPQERERLTQEHMRMMQEHMQTMQRGMHKGMGHGNMGRDTTNLNNTGPENSTGGPGSAR